MSCPSSKFIVVSSTEAHKHQLADFLSTYLKQPVELHFCPDFSQAISAFLTEPPPDAAFVFATLLHQSPWQKPLVLMAERMQVPVVIFRDRESEDGAVKIAGNWILEWNLRDTHRHRRTLDRLFSLVHRRQNEQKQTLKMKQYEYFFQEAPEMHVITRFQNGDQIIVDHNKTFARAIGYPSQSLAGRSLYQFLSESSRERFKTASQRILANHKKSLSREVELLSKRGRVINAVTHVVPEHHAEGRPSGLRIIFVDVSQQKRLEKELRKLSSIIEQMADHVMVTDLNGTIQYVNPAFERITGYAAHEVIGKHSRIIKSGKHPPEFYRNLWNTILSGKVFRDVLINRKKNGELFYEEKTITPIKDEKGNLLYFVSTGKDITERVLQQEQMVQMQKMEAIGRLAAGITHDFNHILALIMAQAEEILYHLPPDDKMRDQMGEIIHAAQSGAKLTRNLLTFSKTQSPEPRKVNLKHSIEKTREMLDRLVPQNIHVRFEAKSDDIFVYMDPAQIDQLILNFVLNARDALPDGGTIQISLDRVTFKRPKQVKNTLISPGRYARIRVTDDGIGMSEEVQKQIFDPFFSTKEKGKGTGLGLSTNYGIVHQNKGFIVVHSQLNQGTTFEVYLPQVTDMSNQPNPRPPAAGDSASSTPTILLVEDSDIIRNVVKEALRRRGYEVLIATNAEEARAYFHQKSSDISLLISDIQLPDANGIDLARQFQQQMPDLKMVLMSGLGFPELNETGLQEGRITFLQKPFTMDEFWQKVESLLEAPN